MYTYRWISVLAAAMLATSASRSDADLIVSLPDVVADPGTSASFDVLLTNPDAIAVAIGGFTIDLSVNPLAGVQFTGVATSPTDQPYMFAGTGAVDAASFPFSFDVFPNAAFTASDIAFTVLSETLGPGETFSLGRVMFEVAGDAVPGLVVPVTLGAFTGLADEQGSPVDFTIDNGSIRISGASTPVPEPSSLVISLALGLIAAGNAWRRRRSA
jgi:hypothetical protein